MTKIQNTSSSFAETKYYRVAAREHILAPPGRHRPRHSRMSLTGCQNTPAFGGTFYYPIKTLYQLQPSFHSQSTEPEPTARARRAGEELYWTTPEFMFVFFHLLVEESIISTRTTVSTIRCSVRAARFVDFASPRFSKDDPQT